MDIYGNSDCKAGPPEPLKPFDAEYFVDDLNKETGVFFDMDVFREIIRIAQAAYDQGRADEKYKAEYDNYERGMAASRRLDEIEKEQQSRRDDPCEK